MTENEICVSDFDEYVLIELKGEVYTDEDADEVSSVWIYMHPDDVEKIIEKLSKELRQAVEKAKKNPFYVSKSEG